MAPVEDPNFLPEIWALFSVGSLWVVMRFGVRLRTVGIRGLGFDDGFAFIALFCWAVIIAGIHCTHFTHTSIDYTPDEVWALTPSQVAGVSWGTKFYIITLYAYITLIFSLKAIVIILYHRLAGEPWQRRLLHFTIFICIVGWTATNLMLSLMCLPYSRRWVVQPLPEEDCTASPNFFVVLSCFNAVSDLLLLTIPIPILWTLQIPLHRRIGVFVLLASGIFVLAACITRVSLTVVPNITVSIIARWGAREISIALVAVNTAALRPMFRKSFWTRTTTVPLAQLDHHRAVNRGNNYMFASILHRRLTRRRPSHSRILLSTSAGVSTIERFAQGRSCGTIPEGSVVASDGLATPPQAVISTASARGKGRFLGSLAGLSQSALGIVDFRGVRSQLTNSDVGTVEDKYEEKHGEVDLEKSKGSSVVATLAREDSRRIDVLGSCDRDDEIRRVDPNPSE